MNSVPFPMPLLKPQELCMLFHCLYIIEDLQVYIEGVISTWKMALLWIIRTSDSKYTRMITSFWVTSWFYKTIYGATPSGHDRQSYHPLFIFSTMMRPMSRLLSLILMIWKRLKFTEPDKNEDLFPVNISGIVSELLILSSSSTLEKSRQIVKKI